MMNTRDSALSVAKCMLMGVALTAAGTSNSLALNYPYKVYGIYGVDEEARDDFAGALGQHSVDETRVADILPSPNNVVDFNYNAPGAEVLSSSSAVQLSVHAEVGKFQVFTGAISNSARQVSDNPFMICEAQSYSSASVNINDYVQLNSKTPGAKIINAKWTISGDVSANALGKVRSSAFAYDYISSTAESWLSVAGTGIQPQPYQGIDVVFDGTSSVEVPGRVTAMRYAASGGTSTPTIDQFTGNPPTSVAISFELDPGVPLAVDWSLEAGALATVQNFDVSQLSGGFAVATGEFSHTVAWGGITSVVDEATGQPITDWSIDSASGFDYAHAVPEPGSLLMAFSFCGLLNLGNCRRRLALADRR